MDENMSIKLSELLSYVKKNITYYKESLDEPNDGDFLGMFEKIKIIDKRFIKSNLLDFIDDAIKVPEINSAINLDKDYKSEYTYNLAGKTVVAEYTSGTSGSPFLSLKTTEERLKIGKNMWKARNSFYPISPKDIFTLTHNFGVNKYPFPFSKPKNEDKQMVKELKFMSNSSYYWWHTNTSKLNRYESVLQKEVIKLPNPLIIENNGSFMSDEEKAHYEKIFKCRIADNYGCRETWMIAFSCPNNHLHINDDNVYFEIVDDDGNIINEPNVTGNVVITSLNQKIMPFIRYKIGDIAYYSDFKCNNKSRQIVLMPGRAKIFGTDIYGNLYYRRVVLQLPLTYGMRNFDEISVVQTHPKKFVVNIKGNMENKQKIESSFIKASEYIFKRSDYEYVFSYVENIDAKSLFCSMVSNR